MVPVSMPKISFLILTYNSEAHIEKLLESLSGFFDEQIKKGMVEIVLVDNHSQDKTLEKITDYRLKIKDLKIVKNKENLGFAKGINIAVSKSSGEYVVIINPDTQYKGGDIFEAVKLFDADGKIGVIGGKIINREGKYEKSAGRFLMPFEVVFMSLGLDELFGVRSSPSNIRQVDFVSGGFMIVKKDLFEKLGGFDENLFMYMEDMEFCFRVKKEGLKVLFDPYVEIVHESHGSSSRAFAIKNIYKGMLYFHKKHGTSLSYSLVKIMLMGKARLLVAFGKIVNNKYLTDTYSQALRL